MTRILQDSLGGESLGMMIVNVAPGESFLQDTHNTLNFATKSREVVNKPVAHEVVEQRWTVGDRLQHHRSTGRHTRPGMVVAAATSSNGVKRRRSDEGGAASEEEGSPGYDERTSSGQRPAARRRISPATSATKYSDHSNAASSAQSSLPRLTQASGRRAAPEQADLVNKVVSAKFHEIEQKTESTSNEIMERVMRIEKQLNDKQLDSNAIIDLFTPATKLKTSRGWLKYARELEQKGDLEKALVHYEEALRYAPELNKLESHIAKLKARIRKVKRRSSIASHGSANVKVASKPDNKAMGATLGLPINGGGGVGDGVDDDDDDDAGPLWMVDGLAESPGAEKAKRRIKSQASGTRPKQPPNLQTQKPLVFNKTVAPAAPVPAPAAGAKTQSKRVKLGADAVNGKRKLSATAGSVHDRRVSFGGSSLNPFVVGGDDFNSELQQRLERKVPVTGTLKTRKLEAKSSAVARLRRTLQAPATPEDRSDKDFVLHSDGSDSDNAREEEELLQQLSNKSSNGAKARRAGRVPGSLGVRGLLVERRKAEEEVKSKLAPSQSKENLPTPSAAANGGGPKPKKAAPSGSSAAAEENLALDQFNDICLASALQMVNSGDVKKIMKLQGIGKRRAEQIQESVQTRGPISHIAELQDRLQFKNKIIVGILSTFA
ncbi:hypothetical protein GGI12_003415 [Dipsacomyces acuminosporus]|nr:hypothetical protein GGI12_003415 [Dipsacomyces acuminosporus]